MGIKLIDRYNDGGLMLLKPEVFEDSRGYFYESYSKKDFFNIGIQDEFVQDNQSRSCKNTIRGLHFQVWPGGQSKLIRATEGSILDVVVDLNPKSLNYKRWWGFQLSSENRKMLYIPNGYGHGFRVLSEHATVQYKVSSYYHPDLEKGIAWNDPDISVDWDIQEKDAIVSDRDKNAPTLSELLLDK